MSQHGRAAFQCRRSRGEGRDSVETRYVPRTQHPPRSGSAFSLAEMEANHEETIAKAKQMAESIALGHIDDVNAMGVMATAEGARPQRRQPTSWQTICP